MVFSKKKKDITYFFTDYAKFFLFHCLIKFLKDDNRNIEAAINIRKRYQREQETKNILFHHEKITTCFFQKISIIHLL